MNLYKENARSRKACDLAETLRSTYPSMPADHLYLMAAAMNADDWKAIAVASQDTINITIQILKGSADRMNIDPFEGLT